MINALQFDDLLVRDLGHLLCIVLLLLRRLQVDHLIVSHTNLLTLVVGLRLTRKSWQLHLHLLLILLLRFSLALLRLTRLPWLYSITLICHLAIGSLELIEILYLKLVRIRM